MRPPWSSSKQTASTRAPVQTQKQLLLANTGRTCRSHVSLAANTRSRRITCRVALPLASPRLLAPATICGVSGVILAAGPDHLCFSRTPATLDNLPWATRPRPRRRLSPSTRPATTCSSRAARACTRVRPRHQAGIMRHVLVRIRKVLVGQRCSVEALGFVEEHTQGRCIVVSVHGRGGESMGVPSRM